MKTINVGLIGCGGFARGMHIPNLKKNPKFRIYAAMDIDPAAADQVAKDTGAEYAATDLHKLLADPAIHAVSNPHLLPLVHPNRVGTDELAQLITQFTPRRK